MTKMAGSVADGIHVHPFHSMHYLHERLVPAVTEGAAEAGRTFDDVDLIIPVFAIPGDTPEERSALIERTRFQIAFYGSPTNYAFQFDHPRFEGPPARPNEQLHAPALPGFAPPIPHDMP